MTFKDIDEAAQDKNARVDLLTLQALIEIGKVLEAILEATQE